MNMYNPERHWTAVTVVYGGSKSRKKGDQKHFGNHAQLTLNYFVFFNICIWFG